MSYSLSFVQLFEPTVLTNAAATIFTAPATPANQILSNGRMRFTNTSNATQAVTAYAVPVAGTAGPGNCFLNGESVAANNHIDVDIPVLKAGEFLQAFAGNASDVTVFALAGTLIAQ